LNSWDCSTSPTASSTGASSSRSIAQGSAGTAPTSSRPISTWIWPDACACHRCERRPGAATSAGLAVGRRGLDVCATRAGATRCGRDRTGGAERPSASRNVDVSDLTAIGRFVAERAGPGDALINNAGAAAG
jgi:hypothetical protein